MTNDEKDVKQALKKILKPGSTVYAVLRHVSRSGMMRHISFYTIKKNELRLLDGYIGTLLDLTPAPFPKQGLKVGGCGMDMGFHIVYNLGRALYPKGFKVKGRGRNGDESGWDKDGGYVFKSEWI